MIDNLIGLAALFRRVWISGPRNEDVAVVAERLVKADMGAAAAQRHMSAWYHASVNEAKRVLRNQDAALGAPQILYAPSDCPIGV